MKSFILTGAPGAAKTAIFDDWSLMASASLKSRNRHYRGLMAGLYLVVHLKHGVASEVQWRRTMRHTQPLQR